MDKEDLKEFVKNTSKEIDRIAFHNDCTKCGARQNRREWNTKSWLGIEDLKFKDNVYSYTQICKNCNKEYTLSFTKEFIHEQIILKCMESFIIYNNSIFKDSSRISYNEKYLNPKMMNDNTNVFGNERYTYKNDKYIKL